MPQSLSQTIIHLIFSTKDREPFLDEYIRKQEEHHSSRTFQEEYRDLLKKTGVDFDEKYVWD